MSAMTKGAGTRICDDSKAPPPNPHPQRPAPASLWSVQLPGIYSLRQTARSLLSASPPPIAKKRKRSESILATTIPAVPPSVGPSKVSQQLPLENRLSNLRPESKKARKRRRKLERQAYEADYRMRVQPMSALHNYPAVAPGMQNWPALPHTYPTPPHFSDPAHLALTPFGMDFVDEYLPYTDDVQNTPLTPPPPPPPPLSGSSWVSSMVMAASTPEYTSYVPPVSDHPKPFAATSLPKAPEVHGLPPKPPPPQQIIGMKPDPDPKSKHGVFTFSKKGHTSNYIPNPARTLVMEQLPKSHRNADFVSSWSRNACDSQPVHISIDSVQGKALVEFATAELARKAWASPKLGSQYAGLKTHQLRGKPREDQIKVWWYRVDGVGAGAGVGEIEEGEIEGEEVDKDAHQSQPKKETKKERKARLAREREEKRQKQEAAQKELALKKALMRGPTAPMPNSSSQTSPVSQPTPMSHVQSASIQLPKPPVPTVPLAHGVVHSYSSGYHQVPVSIWDLPYVAPSTSSLPPPPAHLPPNPLASKREAPKFPVATSLGASLPRGLSGSYEDQESIASSRGEGSKSPEVHASPVIANGNQDGYQDMDLDGDDMELDSPDSPLAPSLPPRPAVEMVLSTPKDRTVPAPASASIIPTGPRAWSILPAGIQGQHKSVLNVPSSSPVAGASSSLSTTPASPRVPSEPKAVRGAPTEPSHKKRSQLARQKEVEERIAKNRIELELAAKKDKPSKFSVSPGATLLPPPSASTIADSSPSTEMDKQAMEDRLRQLVLKSQKSKKQSTMSETAKTPAGAGTSTSLASAANSQTSTSCATNTSGKSPPISPNPTTVSVPTHAASLEDLAVSFIRQTIQTVKAQPPSAATPPLEAAGINPKANLKLELAARQKLLEQHIAESKILMAKLMQARTKEEKDAIIATMREHSRLMEEEERASTPFNGKPSATDVRDPKPTTFKMRWPETQVDAGVFIISDDDESDTADGE
ncbi:hypothetical protein BDQ17DRAFT_1421386 [Cyathus striatus]|nr:hypothetical protein BDQ17DRAFT_1421386 [Cyathus striatus]